MKRIKLTKGKFALVDDEDYEYLNQWKWYCSNSGYAIRAEIIDSNHVFFRMHRIIMNTPSGKFTDHINRNKLDNRKKNLRICSTSQNGMNVVKRSNTSSKYKGVSFSKSNGKWKSQIQINKKYRFLGYYDEEIEAAKAYDSCARDAFGSFAFLNLN